MMLTKRMAGAAMMGMTLLIGCGLFAQQAQAGYIVTLLQEGPDVVATGSGTIDLTGLHSPRPFGGPTGLTPSEGYIVTGPAEFFHFIPGYTGFTGPRNFGNGGEASNNSGRGDIVGINGEFGFLFVPIGYVSGTPLSNTSTYDSATFATLGVTPGLYQWTWGTGTNQNFTLQIGPAGVPEPSSLALLALPLGFVMLLGAWSCNAMRV